MGYKSRSSSGHFFTLLKIGLMKNFSVLILNRRYRLAIRNAVDLIQAEDENHTTREFIETLCAADTLWSLFEAIYMKPQGSPKFVWHSKRRHSVAQN
jgi:hypothetical protein